MNKQPWRLSPKKTRSRACKELLPELKAPTREAKREYTTAEDRALVRYLAAHPVKEGTNVWPQPSNVNYWNMARSKVSTASKCRMRTGTFYLFFFHLFTHYIGLQNGFQLTLKS